MKAILGGGFLFRFMVAGLTSFLMVTVMSMAMSISGAVGRASVTGEITGGFVQLSPQMSMFIMAELAVGLLTFLGSFYVLSKKK